MTVEELLQLAEAETLANRELLVELVVSLPALVQLVGLVQLACRHPETSNLFRQTAHSFTAAIEEKLLAHGLQAVAMIVQAGWNPDFDGTQSVPAFGPREV